MLDSLPVSFGKEGIWFVNFRKVLDLAGAPRPKTFEEFVAWPEDQRQQYLNALGGFIVSNHLVGMRFDRRWTDAFGFSPLQVHTAVSPGPVPDDVLLPSFFTGEFDSDLVTERLDALGYRPESASDRRFYAIRNDFEQDLKDPVGRFALGSANRIFVDDTVVVLSPNTEPVADTLQVLAGESPSLLDSPAFGAIAAELSDPLSAVILTREITLTPPRGHLHVEYDKPADWGSLNDWESFGAGFSQTAEVTTLRYSLYYPDPDWAGLDAEELTKRAEHFLSNLEYEWLPGLGKMEVVPGVCDSWGTMSTVYGDGSVLTLTCEFPNNREDPNFLGNAWITLVWFRQLGFLVP